MQINRKFFSIERRPETSKLFEKIFRRVLRKNKSTSENCFSAENFWKYGKRQACSRYGT